MQKDKFYKSQSFPLDPREWDPYRGTRLFSDFFQLEDWTGFATTAAGFAGSVPVAESKFDSGVTPNPHAGIGTVAIPAARGAGSKSEIRDRTSDSINPGIMFGRHEMDFQCRFQNNTTDNASIIRIGFYDDTADLTGNNESRYGLFFYIRGGPYTTATLFVGIFNDWTGTASATSYKFTKDTGIKSDAYENLGIYVNKDATDVVFTVNGIVVHRQTNDIPHYLRGSWVATPSRRCQAGIAVQSIATTSTTNAASVDWMQMRVFNDRGI